jgi:hypothetical protein
VDVIKAPAADRAQPLTSASRWIGVGASTDPDSRQAGVTAATTALRGTDSRLLVVFASPAHDLAAMLEGVRSIAPTIPLVGCTTAGEIATDGPSDASVVVTAIGGSGFTVSTNVARNASSDLRQAGATAASCAETGVSDDHQVLLLLTDGLGGDQREVVRGAYSVVGGSVPLVGGCAGDNMAMKKTFQFFDGEVLEDSVVAAAINSDAPLGIGVQHGWSRVGAPFLVTASSGTRVLALDDRPALDVYLERLDAPKDARTDPAAFTRFALTHPFGLSRRSGEEVRFIAEANFEGRSIGCIAEVPQGGLAWIMEGDAGSVLDATAAACTQAVDGLFGRTPLGFLAFDCIARRGVLGDEGIRQEVARITSFSRGAPVAGFYTYGEIARTSGVNGFHNQTLVVLAFG